MHDGIGHMTPPRQTPLPADSHCAGGTHPTGMHSFFLVYVYMHPKNRRRECLCSFIYGVLQTDCYGQIVLICLEVILQHIFSLTRGVSVDIKFFLALTVREKYMYNIVVFHDVTMTDINVNFS